MMMITFMFFTQFLLMNMKLMIKFIHINLLIIFFLMMMLLNMKFLMFNIIYNYMALDNYSYSLFMLTLWIMSFSIMANFDFLMNKNYYKFMMLMLMFMLNMLMFFSSMNIFLFFIFFELSLIPMIFLIMGWGKQIDRIQSSMYLLFYTLFGSLPLLLLIIYIYNNMNSISMNLISLMNNNYYNMNMMMFIIMNLGFLMKLPMFIIHSWLPKAHVESPVSGSMILAGIMLKMGSYGIIRFLMMFMNFYNKYNTLIILMSLWGSILCSILCLNMNDLKVIIAFSSIVHMNYMLSSMIMNFNWSIYSSLYMMMAHGLCSPLMFFLSFIMYKRSKSRNLYFNKGLINILPNLSMWWFLISICNMSSPPSLNLFSEIMIMISLNKFSNYMIMININLIFFSSIYNIFFFYSTQNKYWNLMNFNFKMINNKELMILYTNYMILNIMFFNIYIMM